MADKALLACCILLSVCASLEAKMMDMSHVLNKHSLHGQMFRNFSKTLIMNETFLGSKPWFKAFNVEFAEHTGTHMDAPIHSYPGMREIHQIPYEQLVGPVVVFDVREKAKTDRDYGLVVSDIEEFEATHGRIPDGSITLIGTGGSELYHNTVSYLGTEKTWDITTMHYPGFTNEVVEWLIKNRKIKGLGSDRLGFDPGKDTTFPVHYTIAINQVFGLENVANVHKIPVYGATIVTLPMAVEGGSGFPTRIMAFWGENNELIFSGGDITKSSCFILAFFSAVVSVSILPNL